MPGEFVAADELCVNPGQGTKPDNGRRWLDGGTGVRTSPRRRGESENKQDGCCTGCLSTAPGWTVHDGSFRWIGG